MLEVKYVIYAVSHADSPEEYRDYIIGLDEEPADGEIGGIIERYFGFGFDYDYAVVEKQYHKTD